RHLDGVESVFDLERFPPAALAEAADLAALLVMVTLAEGNGETIRCLGPHPLVACMIDVRGLDRALARWITFAAAACRMVGEEAGATAKPLQEAARRLLDRATGVTVTRAGVDPQRCLALQGGVGEHRSAGLKIVGRIAPVRRRQLR